MNQFQQERQAHRNATTYNPSSPLRLGGRALPKAPLLDVARSFHMLPSEDDFIQSIKLRIPEFSEPGIERWLRNNLAATMPRAHEFARGRNRCGECTCNVLGHPLRAHSIEDCGIPIKLRPKFNAINTRGYCKTCRGRSDKHTCLGAEEECRQCARKGIPKQDHQPSSGLCGTPNQSVNALLTKYRKEQYEHNARISTEEPLAVKMYNDSPLEGPDIYQRFYGSPPYVDTNKEMMPVFYVEGSSYPGLIPAHHTEERKQMDEFLDQRATVYYASSFVSQSDVPPDVYQQIMEYKAEEKRMEDERKKGQPQRDKEMEKKYGVKSVSSHSLLDGAGGNFVVADAAPPPQPPPTEFEQWIEDCRFTSTLSQVPQNLHESDVYDRWLEGSWIKVERLISTNQSLKIQILNQARQAQLGLAQRNQGQAIFQPFFINNEVVRDRLRDIISQRRHMDYTIEQLELVLLGQVLEKPATAEGAGQSTHGWKDDYLNLLLLVALYIIQKEKSATYQSLIIEDIHRLRPTSGSRTFQFPSPQLIAEFPPTRKDYFYANFALQLINQLQ